MTPGDLHDTYFTLLVGLMSVADAMSAADALVARDSASRWWRVAQ